MAKCLIYGDLGDEKLKETIYEVVGRNCLDTCPNCDALLDNPKPELEEELFSAIKALGKVIWTDTDTDNREGEKQGEHTKELGS